jgi:hypothetical protein
MLLCVFAVGYYFSFVEQYAMNIPLGDDIHDILQVVTEVDKSDSLLETIGLMYEQHNDHRTIASRLVYWLVYTLQGEVDFRTLTFVANVGLILLLLLLFAYMPRDCERWFILLPAALVLFQIRAYGLTLWPMAAFAYFYVYVYGFASLYCLRSLTLARFLLAILFATLASFTLASGQVIWVVGMVSLCLYSLQAGRIKWGYIAAWAAMSVFVLWLWRLGLETPNTPAALLQNLLSRPVHFFHYFLALLGTSVSENSVAAVSVAGAIMLFLLIWISWRQYRNDMGLELACWFVVLSTAAVVLGRAPLTDVEYTLSARYSFPSVIMLASVVVLVCVRFTGKINHLLLALSMLTAGYWAHSWSVYPSALQPYMEKRVVRFNKGIFWTWGSQRGENRAIVEEAIERGIYNPPEKPYSPFETAD